MRYLIPIIIGFLMTSTSFAANICKDILLKGRIFADQFPNPTIQIKAGPAKSGTVNYQGTTFHVTISCQYDYLSISWRSGLIDGDLFLSADHSLHLNINHGTINNEPIPYRMLHTRIPGGGH